MKKSLLAIAFAMVAMVSSAQVYVGGSLNLTSKSGDNSSTTNFTIAPEVGYVYSDNISFGASFDYTSTSAKAEFLGTETKTSSFTWNFQPYVRYTFFNAGILSCFVDGVVELSGVKDSDTNFGIHACPGIALNVTDNVSLVSRLGKIGWSNANNSTITVNANASIASVGVYYTF